MLAVCFLQPLKYHPRPAVLIIIPVFFFVPNTSVDFSALTFHRFSNFMSMFCASCYLGPSYFTFVINLLHCLPLGSMFKNILLPAFYFLLQCRCSVEQNPLLFHQCGKYFSMNIGTLEHCKEVKVKLSCDRQWRPIEL